MRNASRRKRVIIPNTLPRTYCRSLKEYQHNFLKAVPATPQVPQEKKVPQLLVMAGTPQFFVCWANTEPSASSCSSGWGLLPLHIIKKSLCTYLFIQTHLLAHMIYFSRSMIYLCISISLSLYIDIHIYLLTYIQRATVESFPPLPHRSGRPWLPAALLGSGLDDAGPPPEPTLPGHVHTSSSPGLHKGLVSGDRQQ